MLRLIIFSLKFALKIPNFYFKDANFMKLYFMIQKNRYFNASWKHLKTCLSKLNYSKCIPENF